MPKEIYLVKVGMTMTEGIVSEWYIDDGAKVTQGQMLYALETEKVNLDVDADAAGTVRHLAEVGVTHEPGDVIGFIFAEGESVPDQLTAIPTEKQELEPIEASGETAGEAAREKPASTLPNITAHVKSSPAARKLAAELGVDIAGIKGSGPAGRIIKEDILAASTAGPAPEARSRNIQASPAAKRLARDAGIDLGQVVGSGPGGRIVEADITAIASAPSTTSIAGQTIPVSSMRRTIARRMFSSLQTSAQLTMDMQVTMDDAVKMREQLISEWQAEGVRPTYTDLVIKAVAKALVRHPIMNSVYGEKEITLLPRVNVGIAVALDEGLVVPVLRDADRLDLKVISQESARLSQAARDGKLGLDDYAGGTFTVSSLGMFGVDSFTPIINEPQAGILGVNRLYDGTEWEDERPVRTRKMNLSLTWDHRVLDGSPAAEFLAEVRTLLAEPFRLLV